MTYEPTEDVPYRIDEFAIEDDSAADLSDDEQTAETRLINAIRTYLEEAEQEHNSLDLIDLTEQAKMTATQQIAVHKLVAQHIRGIRNIINSKVREN